MSPTCQRFWNCYNTLAFCSLVARSRMPCACRAKPHPNFKKCSGNGVLCTFWLPNVLRTTTALRFFDISTSKSGPNMVCLFVHFDLEMCFAPQRRALFRHLNFRKCSENEVFCTFSLRHVLRVTTACNFSSPISSDGSAPAALASLLFDPAEPQITGKTLCFATFPPFRPSASSFLWLFLFSDLLSSSLLFSSLTLPISAFHLSL